MQNPVTVLQSDKAPEERYLQSRVPLVAGALATLGLIGSLIVAGYGWDTPVPKEGPWPRIKILEAIIVVGWLLLPPVYFWYEYFYVYGRTRNAAARADLESFKYGQDVASKIWIAVVSALLALYFGKDFRLG